MESLFETVETVAGGNGQVAFSDFERRAAPSFHEKLALPSRVAGNAAFWRWLTFSHDGEFAALVDWRYGKGEPGRAALQHFGVGQIKRSMYGYLWLRANSVFDPSRDDPYELCRRGDVDIWQSHIVRIDFGSVPAMARGFIRFVHPAPGRQRLTREEYRGLQKELTRRNAAFFFECFCEEDAVKFVSHVWEDRDAWWDSGS